MRLKTRLLRNVAISTALLGLLLATSADHAAGSRVFSAFYELSHITALGDNVSVTLTLQLFNHGDADVYDVALTVLAMTSPEIDLGTLSSPFISSDGTAHLSGDLIMVREEYAIWQQGSPRMPRIEFSYAAGERGVNFVELALIPLSREN